MTIKSLNFVLGTHSIFFILLLHSTFSVLPFFFSSSCQNTARKKTYYVFYEFRVRHFHRRIFFFHSKVRLSGNPVVGAVVGAAGVGAGVAVGGGGAFLLAGGAPGGAVVAGGGGGVRPAEQGGGGGGGGGGRRVRVDVRGVAGPAHHHQDAGGRGGGVLGVLQQRGRLL